MRIVEPLALFPLMESVRTALPSGLTVHLVGGAVRDALLGRASHDLDFVLDGDGVRTARRVANALKADFYPLDPERATGRVIVTAKDGRRTFMDFATLRSPDLQADLAGRDFTLNAIAMDIQTEAIYDPMRGVADLKKKCLRLCSPTAILDDPVRILRAVRLAAAYGFRILPDTLRAMQASVVRLGKTSPERLRDELFRILEGPQPADCLRTLDDLEALVHFLPELVPLKGAAQPAPHVHDVWEHTLATFKHLESILAALVPAYELGTGPDRNQEMLVLRLGDYSQKFAEHFAGSLNINRSLRGLLFLAALYHDVAKPACRTTDLNDQERFWEHDQRGSEVAVERARQLAMSNDECDRLGVIIRNHMRILFHTKRLSDQGKPPTRRAIYRFFRDCGEAGVDIVLLALADMRATYEQNLPQKVWGACLEVCHLFLENWWEKPEESITPPVLVNGDDLLTELAIQPGPKVGELLEAIREAQATGKVLNRQQALDLARDLLKEPGSAP